MKRTYSELILLPTWNERFEYLKLNGHVGDDTFGIYRWLNQVFYKSPEWRMTRRSIIIRDDGNDMGLLDFPIEGPIYVHHMNPISVKDITNKNLDVLLNPEYLITLSFDTHQSITYGRNTLYTEQVIERRPNDTCPWKR